MEGEPQRIIGKRLKQPRDVLYQVEFLVDGYRKIVNWVELVRLVHYVPLIEQYELTQVQQGYSEIINKQGVKIEDVAQEESQIIPFSQITIPKRNNRDKRPLNDGDAPFIYKQIKEKEEPFELNKELKRITRQYFKGGKQSMFQQDSILKIITYSKDELDVNRFQFLVQWKQKNEGRPVLPSWVTQGKMEQCAPELLKEYAEEKNIQLAR